MEKLGICGRLTDSPATGTGRFGTLGIWRFTFGRFTLGRLLVKLLQKQTKKETKKSITVAMWNAAKKQCKTYSKKVTSKKSCKGNALDIQKEQT